MLHFEVTRSGHLRHDLAGTAACEPCPVDHLIIQGVKAEGRCNAENHSFPWFDSQITSSSKFVVAPDLALRCEESRGPPAFPPITVDLPRLR